MTSKEYIQLMLTKKQIRSLDKRTPILIDGPQGPTGKTTLKNALEKEGYTVFERCEVNEITLDRAIGYLISNIVSD